MDGIKDRMSGRYERNHQSESQGGYQGQYREYEARPLERPGRSAVVNNLSIEEISAAINNSNQEQINVLAEYFDEAKADRMESERAIIEALSGRIEEMISNAAVTADEEEEEIVPETAPEEVQAPQEAAPEESEIIDEAEEESVIPAIDPELLQRIERIVGQNGEGISENEEIAQRSLEFLRSQSGILNTIKEDVESIKENQNSAQAYVAPVVAPEPSLSDLTIDFSEEKDEIISAVSDNRAILNMIRQDVLNGFAKFESIAEEPEDEYAVLHEEEQPQEAEAEPAPELLSKELGEKRFQAIEDLIHSECVKVFKNVKKTIEEENEKAAVETKKTISGLRLFVIVSLAINAITLVLLALMYLGSL